MKYMKAGVAAAALIALGVISFHGALAQQGPDSSSSETVARPRKRNPPAEVPADPVNTEPTNTAPAAAPANVPTNDEPAAADEPKIPSKFSKKGKEVPESTPTFSSD